MIDIKENMHKEILYRIRDISTEEYKEAPPINTILKELAPIENILYSVELVEEVGDENDVSWNESYIKKLKTQIKHCKNPMELRRLNQELDEAYKKRRKCK